MAFQMSCDRCGRFIKNVKGGDLKQYIHTEPLCTVCIDTEEQLQKKISTIQRRAEVDFKRMAETFKELVKEEIHKSVLENYDDT